MSDRVELIWIMTPYLTVSTCHEGNPLAEHSGAAEPVAKGRLDRSDYDSDLPGVNLNEPPIREPMAQLTTPGLDPASAFYEGAP